MKENCWEYKKCGREPGGLNAKELGVCPAAVETRTNGMNDGKNGGRCCWGIAGTFCGGKVEGTYAQKCRTCLDCSFFNVVFSEEYYADNYTTTIEIIKALKE